MISVLAKVEDLESEINAINEQNQDCKYLFNLIFPKTSILHPISIVLAHIDLVKSEIANLKNRSSATEFVTSARIIDENLEEIRIDLDNIKRLDAKGNY